jgi:hypothetical protein
MSINPKAKIESRQQQHKAKNKINNINKILSSNTLGSINKEASEKKILKDSSLHFLKNITSTSLTNKTYANHIHKKIIIKEKLKFNENRKIALNLNNHGKYAQYPLKLNYKPSMSLKNLIEEDNLLNSDKRKNTNTKIELFSTNSTLSFLNIKDNNKELLKPVKIKRFNYNKTKKIFSSTFIERKIRQKTKANTKLKIKHIINNLSLDKKPKKLQKNQQYLIKDNNNNIINNSNKSIEFCFSYMKPINKRRNLSLGINDNSNNSNTNSIKDLYKKKIKHKTNSNSSILLYDNKSFSLNKKKNNESGYGCGQGRGSSFSKKRNISTYCQKNFNNKSKTKFNLSSLPNLLCNNYMNMQNKTISNNDLFNNKFKKVANNNKNKRSYPNLFDKKNSNKNLIKLNNNSINKYKNNYNESNKKYDVINNNNENNSYKQLNNIHLGIKSLLD